MSVFLTFPLVFYLGFKCSLGLRFLLKQFASSFWFFAYRFVPSLFLSLIEFWLFTNCFSIQLLALQLYAFACNLWSNDWIRWAFRVFTFLRCSSLCLYNSNKKLKLQDGKLYKLTEMNLCRIQNCACERQKLLTTVCGYDTINMLGRSNDRPIFL